MTTFFYRATDRQAHLVSGTLAADSDPDARSELRRRGLYLLEFGDTSGRPEGPPFRAAGWLWHRLLRFLGHPHLLRPLRSPRAVTLEFTRELATLLEARFPLDRSLALLAEIVRDPETAEMVRGLRARVREGARFSEALRAYPRCFGEVYTRLIAAGEEGGGRALDVIVRRLAAHLEERAAVRSRIASALVYPAVMTVAGGAALLVLLLAVLPKFVAVMEGAGRALPLSTAALVGLSGLVTGYWWLLALLAALAAWALAAYRRTPQGRLLLDRLDLTAPLWGTLRRDGVVAQFCRTLGMLLGSGVPFLTAVRTAGATIRNAVVGQTLARVEEQVRNGGSMAEALQGGPVFPDLAVQMLRVGEESGELPAMLDKAADIYERRLRERTDRLVALLEPALIVCFGLAVGFVALAIFEAIYGIQGVAL